MLMRVRENGDKVLIELNGIAGRQQSVLRALSECRGSDDAGLATADVSVRAGANAMRISLRARPGLRVEPTTIYRCLREALCGRPAADLGQPAALAQAGAGAVA